MLHETQTRELSPRRQRTRERRTEQIVQTALVIVADEGFEALTMGRLAKQLDVSAGGLYRYFSSKDALVAELQARNLVRIRALYQVRRDGWSAQLPVSDPPCAEDAQLRSLCELLASAAFYLNLQTSEPRLFRMVCMTLAHPDELVDDEQARRVAPSFMGLLSELGQLFTEATKLDALRAVKAPLEQPLIYWAALHGVMSIGKLRRLAPSSSRNVSSDALSLNLALVLLRGWGADPDQLESARKWLEMTHANP